MEHRWTSDSAIEQVYHDYRQPILRYLERLVHQHETAEDLLQETFVKALRHWEQLGQTTSVRGWLYCIATNTAYDYLRRQRRLGFVTISTDHAELPTPQTPEPRWEDSEPIRTALNQIPDNYRVPLLYALAGFEFKEIAALIGSNVNTVKTRVHRARARFRQVYVA